MKRMLIIFIAVIFLSGCTKQKTCLDQAVEMREQLLGGNGCTFKAILTADYQDVIYTFAMYCSADREGNVGFSVISPDTISGISGTLSENGGELQFDEQALLFEAIADGLISPICAPWIFLNILRSGYIDGCAEEADGLFIQYTDSYHDEIIKVNVTTEGLIPVRGEIIWNEQRIMTIVVEDYCVL